jgi:hypothetical protein
MSKEPADSEMQGVEEVDPGEPIAVLAELEHYTSSGLLPRVRRAIQRRLAAAQLVSFVAGAAAVVLRELWFLLNEQLGSRDPRKDDSHGKKAP